MRRSGIIVWEALIGIVLLGMVYMAAGPLVSHALRGAAQNKTKTESGLELLFALHFMEEKIRGAEDSGCHVSSDGEVFSYLEIRDGRPESYAFYVTKEKLYVRLYNGRIQPVTGKSGGPYEATAFVSGRPLFVMPGKGLLQIHCGMQTREGGTDMADLAVMNEKTYFSAINAHD